MENKQQNIYRIGREKLKNAEIITVVVGSFIILISLYYASMLEIDSGLSVEGTLLIIGMQFFVTTAPLGLLASILCFNWIKNIVKRYNISRQDINHHLYKMGIIMCLLPTAYSIFASISFILYFIAGVLVGK